MGFNSGFKGLREKHRLGIGLSEKGVKGKVQPRTGHDDPEGE